MDDFDWMDEIERMAGTASIGSSNSTTTGYEWSHTRSRMNDVKHKMNEILKNKAMISKKQVEEIEELKKEIDRLQFDCMHSWEICHLFQHVRRFCGKCDHEDRDYNHFF
jgi:hypothetical protein